MRGDVTARRRDPAAMVAPVLSLARKGLFVVLWSYDGARAGFRGLGLTVVTTEETVLGGEGEFRMVRSTQFTVVPLSVSDPPPTPR